MAWRLTKVEDQRQQLITAYESKEKSMTALCKQYGVSRKTGYKWWQRYLEFGEEGLKDLCKAPHNPYRFFTEDQIQRALDLKRQHRTWGPKKILAKLRHTFPSETWPSPTRLYEIFKEYHLVTSRRLRNRVPATHPLGDVNDSNDVWMADFKGWFLLLNHEKCEPLTITDGFSRYLIRCDHLSKKSADFVWPVFEEAFREYGLPNRIRTDNGPPFGCIGIGRLTRLSINLIKAGVVPEWINPGHPEENGRHERFHLTLKNSVANPPAETLKEQIALMKSFQEEYNYDRPHEALNMQTPSEVYHCSLRKWDGILRAPEYDTSEWKVRKVCPSGCIWINSKEYYISTLLTGDYVGLKENEENEISIHYGPVYLGKITEKNGLEKPKLKKKKIVRRG